MDFASDFQSVREASRLRLAPCTDPSEARALLEQIRALSEVKPLADLLRVCDVSTAPELAHNAS